MIMLVMLFVFVGNILMTIVFWWKELRPAISVYTRGPGDQFKVIWAATMPFRVLIKCAPLVMDILITLTLSTIFIHGDSMVGSVAGLTASNVVSMIIMYLLERKTDESFLHYGFVSFWRGKWAPDAWVPPTPRAKKIPEVVST